MPESIRRNREEQAAPDDDESSNDERGASSASGHETDGHGRKRQRASSARAHPPRAGDVMAEGQDALQQAVAEVKQEQRPRRLAIRYGREWLAIYLIVVAVVVALAIVVHSTSILPGDVGIERELQENRSPLVFVSMVAVSWLGYEPQAMLIFLLALAALVVLRLRLEAVFLALSELGDLISEVVKIIVARARPSTHLVDVVTHLSSYSFPSGHTVHYTVFYGFLAFIIVSNFRPHWIRQVCLAVCIGLIALVGFSRVYLGEHWPTDVFAGYLIGGLFLVPLIAAYLWAKDHVIITSHWPFFAWRDEFKWRSHPHTRRLANPS